MTILLVERRAHQAMQIADWCYVLVAGRVELNDAPAALLARPDFGELFLGRSAAGTHQASHDGLTAAGRCGPPCSPAPGSSASSPTARASLASAQQAARPAPPRSSIRPASRRRLVTGTRFTDDPDATTCLPLVASGRVAVLRTFSKIHGLAGLRVGYLIADPGIITTLRKIRAPFSVGTLAQAGALAALGDPGHAAQVRARTLRARAELTRLFEHAGYPVIPSQANFILVQAPDEHALVSRLAEHAIAVRPGTALGIPGTVRVSVPSQRGLRLLHSALRPTPGRPPAESCRRTGTGSP